MDRVTFSESLKNLLVDGMRKVNCSFTDCSALCLGLAGMGREKEKNILQEIVRDWGYHGELTVTDDAHIALTGGAGRDTGIILICGTGSICFGRNERGNTCRAGGWGYIAGDEGSGYDIGLCAVKYTFKYLDGRERGQEAILPGLVMESLKVHTTDDLLYLIYKSGEGKNKIASLAPVVDEANSRGDPKAEYILRYAADELFQCSCAVIDRLIFDEKPVPFVFSGSVLLKSETIHALLKKRLEEAYPEIKAMDIKNDAAWGAVLVALKQANGKGKPI
jgi:N-acetylglucosamine kinase-like BadF-type ATPase